ncbi:hypothetical protein [Priestia sp. YIM B13490]|uniref:hypothetical protein n=1 Tax=Priestia sp. YIM B13490 TaxID=3366310 RepID=UPI0036718F81
MEAAIFVGTQKLLQLAKAGPDIISYTVWSFAMEFEARPEIRDVLRISTLEFFDFLKGDENPNGLWAWLSQNDMEVQQQLKLFETNDQRRWWKFAYGSTKFNQWVSEPDHENAEGRKSPRLDYLVLDGLNEKGAPLGVVNIPTDWFEMFKKSLDTAFNNFKKQVLESFKAGSFSRGAYNEFGEFIQETWYNTIQYSKRKTYRGEGTLEYLVWDSVDDLIEHLQVLPKGEWQEEYWKKHSQRYYKGIWSDKSATAEKMVFREIINNSNIQSIETWNGWGGQPKKYWKTIYMSPQPFAEKVFEVSVNSKTDELVQEIWNQALKKYSKCIWSDSTGAPDKAIYQKIITDDTMTIEYWNKGFTKYIKETYSGSSEREDKLRWKFVLNTDDEVIQEVWDKHKKYGKTIINKAGKVIHVEGEIPPKSLPDWWPNMNAINWNNIQI